MKKANLKKLAEPFPADCIEWRVGRAGKRGDRVWAMVLAYVTNRAIQDRLDEVCGPADWRNEFCAGPNGGVLCGLSIMVEDVWITKWDGAENTDFESVKGGLSGAMKRAGVHWGIGRYLYGLDETWADINDNGAHYQPKDKQDKYPAFKWDAPELPAWALPGGAEPPKKKASTKPKAKDRLASLKEFHLAWDGVSSEATGGDEPKTNRLLEAHFLWAKGHHSIGDFDAKADYMRPLEAGAIDKLTAILKGKKRNDVIAWLETDPVRVAVGLPLCSVQACAGCFAILTEKEKANSDTVGLPKGYCEKCRPAAVVEMMGGKDGEA